MSRAATPLDHAIADIAARLYRAVESGPAEDMAPYATAARTLMAACDNDHMRAVWAAEAFLAFGGEAVAAVGAGTIPDWSAYALHTRELVRAVTAIW